MVSSTRITRFFTASSLAVAILCASNAKAVWTGAIDGNLENPGNWSEMAVPTGLDADFLTATAPDPTAGDLNPRGLWFDTNSRAYNIGGGTITLTPGTNSRIDTVRSAANQTLSNAVLNVTAGNNILQGVVAGSHASGLGTGTLTIASGEFHFSGTGQGNIRAVNGDIRITSPIFTVTGGGSRTLFTETAARTITVDTPMNVGRDGNSATTNNAWFRNNGTIWINNGFTGTGTKDSPGGHVGIYMSGRTVLGDSGSWDGNITVEAGILEINDSTSLGAGGAGGGYTRLTTDENTTGSGRLHLTSGIDVNETIRLIDRASGGMHHLANAWGSNTFSGNIDIFAAGGGNYIHLRSDSPGETLTVAGTVTSNLTVDRIVTFRGDGDTLLSGNNRLVQASTGKLSLQKENLGTMTIADDQNYTGTTSVLGGTLVVNGAHTGGDAYTVGNGGTLGGNGSIDANVTVNVGGTLAPGASVGTLTVDHATIHGTLAIQYDGSAIDKFVVNGAGGPLAGDFNGDTIVNAADYVLWRDALIDGDNGYSTWRGNFGASGGGGAALQLDGATLHLELIDFASWEVGEYVIAEYTSLDGTFANFTGWLPIDYSIDYGDENNKRIALVVTAAGASVGAVAAVPEPSALLLLATALAAAACIARRR